MRRTKDYKEGQGYVLARPFSPTSTRLDCPALACYNQIDIFGRREFRLLRSGIDGARGNPMKNPLDSLWGTVITGLILTVILYFVVKSILT
jgi:hypothetical protein